MPKYSDPTQAYEDIKRNFTSKQQFYDLIEICEIWSKYNDPGIIFKKFIPNRTKYPEFGLFAQSEDWDQAKCDKATELLIEAYTQKDKLFNSYLIEKTEFGNFIAFTTINQRFSNHFENYIYESRNILKKGKKNGIVISAKEWLEKFQFEYYSSFKNRNDALHWYVSLKQRAMDDKEFFSNKDLDWLFVHAITDGGSTFGSIQYHQIADFKENESSWNNFIRKWNPKGEFTIAYELNKNSGFNPPSEEEKNNLIKDFLNDFSEV